MRLLVCVGFLSKAYQHSLLKRPKDVCQDPWLYDPPRREAASLHPVTDACIYYQAY